MKARFLAVPLVVCMSLPAAASSAVPYTDPAVKGGIGLCDVHDKPVTSGKLADTPFVWKAVSTVAAPTGYTDERAKATLYAFQPRQGVDPADWSGTAIAASTRFTDPNHPVEQFTYADQGLLPFTQAYPPSWDGYVQLRLLFSGIDRPSYADSYPALDLKVEGDTWRVVAPVRVDCVKPKGTSAYTDLLPPARLASPKPRPGGSSDARPSAGASASPTDPHAASATDRTGSHSWLGVLLGLLGAGVVAMGAGALVARRRARG